MENIHEWINSTVLLYLGVLYFSQDRILKYMRTAMETINPEKIKKAQEFIDEGKEYELKIKLNDKIKEITNLTGQRFQEVNKDFLAKYDELLNIPFQIMREKDWQYREQHLVHYPKNAEALRAILEAYDNGEFSPEKDNKG